MYRQNEQYIFLLIEKSFLNLIKLPSRMGNEWHASKCFVAFREHIYLQTIIWSGRLTIKSYLLRELIDKTAWFFF